MGNVNSMGKSGFINERIFIDFFVINELSVISRVQWYIKLSSIYYRTRENQESREMNLRNHAMRKCQNFY